MEPKQIKMTRPADLLIVDDDRQSRKLLENYLRPEGYRLRTAASGEEALRLIEERAPDIALLDVMMPGMTGLELCEEIKGNPDTRLVQVMMVTALNEEAHRVEGLDTGADDYVAKPIQREEFLAKVRALVRARALLEALESTCLELEARNRELELKKTLAQTVVHDLKSPLTAVVGNLDLLSMRVEGDHSRFVKRAKVSLDRLNSMVLDLMDVECLEDGAYDPDVEEVDLLKIAREAVAEFEVQHEILGVDVRLVPSEECCVVEGDPALLRRTVDNLLANALAHSKKGMEIVLAISRQPEGIRIDVTDQGPGVPLPYREAIFEKYSQLELREAGVRKSRGLGLTLCRLAVEIHGGSIWVENAEAGGAVFRLVLPEAVAEADEESGDGPGIDLWLSAASRKNEAPDERTPLRLVV